MPRIAAVAVALAVAVVGASACTNDNLAPDARRSDGGFVIDFDGPTVKTPCGSMEANGDQACAQASWQFSTETADGQNFEPLDCPVGFDTVAVVGQKATAAGDPLAACDASSTSNDTTCFVDLFDCSIANGQQILPRGFATQYLAVTNSTGSQVYGTSPTTFEVLDGITFQGLFANLIDNGGYIRASWALSRGGSPATCTSVGNQTFVTVATSLSFAQFPCDSGDNAFDYTTALPAGTYTVTAQLVDSTSTTIGSASTASVVVGNHDDLATTGTISLDVP